MAHLQQIICYGIWFEEDSERFASMTDLPISELLLQKHYLVLASGSAAERICRGDYSPSGATFDKAYFEGSKAPSFDFTVGHAETILRPHKSAIRKLQSILKEKFIAAEYQPLNLPGVIHNGRAYRVLLSDDELSEVVTGVNP